MNQTPPPHLQKSLNHPLLSEDLTRTLIERAQAGDRDAADELLAHNERLVYRVCQKYYRTGATGDSSIDDLMQEGRMGLLRAIEKFELARNIKFSTYATWWIRQRVRRFGIRGGMQFSMAYANVEKRAQALNARSRLAQSLGHEPTITEIIAHTNLSQIVARSITIQVLSLDAEKSFPPDDDGQALLERLFDDDVPDPETAAAEKIEADHILKMIGGLSTRAQNILYRYFYLGQSLEAIAAALHLNSSTHVRKIRDQALRQIREICADRA